MELLFGIVFFTTMVDVFFVLFCEFPTFFFYLKNSGEDL